MAPIRALFVKTAPTKTAQKVIFLVHAKWTHDIFIEPSLKEILVYLELSIMIFYHKKMIENKLRKLAQLPLL
jgi:hypothetical protein